MDKKEFKELKKEMVNIWDKVASDFDNVGPKFWSYFGNRLVDIAEIPEGAKVLDIGSGRGSSLFPAALKVGQDGRAIGIDTSLGMVEETCNEMKKLNLASAEMLYMDAEKLGFEDETFDYVICGFGIMYLYQQDNKFSEVLRVLKKDGQICFSNWAEQDEWISKIVNKYLSTNPQKNNDKKVEDVNKINLCTVSGMKEVLQNAEFENVEVFMETKEFIYKDEEEWWEQRWATAMRGILEQVKEVGEDKLQDMKLELFKELQQFKDKDGIHINFLVIFAKAHSYKYHK